MISYETFTLISLWLGYAAVVALILIVFTIAGTLIHYYWNKGWWPMFEDRELNAWLRDAITHYEKIEPMPKKKHGPGR